MWYVLAWVYNQKQVTKISSNKPILVTEDGVELFEGNEYWIVCPRSNYALQKEPPLKHDYYEKDWGYKYFYSKEKAEDYIKLYK
jgi:hypothetical protein